MKISTKPNWGIAACFLTLLAASACNRAPNVMTGYEKAAGGMATELQIANPGLQKKVALVDAQSRRVNDVLQISIRLQNTTDKWIHFEHKLQWFDADDFEIIDAKTHWIPATILGGESKLIQGMAPGPQATTFKLLARPPEPVQE